jgi:hypothetical protein
VVDPGKAIPSIFSALEAAGIGVVSLKEINPTLEDVFVDLASEVA